MSLLGSQPRSLPPTSAKPVSTNRTLIVGKGLTVAGEIKDCDCLVVEGEVSAEVSCKELTIAPGGLFAGTARVMNAEVIGRFEGDLKVTERLVVRATGSVSGEVRYQLIEIERGGRISGRIDSGNVTESTKTTAAGQRSSA
ncbi:MAG TPA: polymer-forming cytoskeletal protein [Stellaceae bacterium]|nr:polymer-forming cytoskeletal protein [Stellaceae bacterium]